MVMMILERTPIWVYGLFLGLLALGWMQSQDRIVPYFRAFIVPFIMMIFSIYGVVSAFGMSIAVIFWSAGIILVMVFGIRMRIFYNAVFMEENQAFAIKGSWFWLGLMMVIFWLKFAVGAALARQLAIVSDMWFVIGISLCYGLLSGVFLMRMVILWKIKSLHIKAK